MSKDGKKPKEEEVDLNDLIPELDEMLVDFEMEKLIYTIVSGSAKFEVFDYPMKNGKIAGLNHIKSLKEKFRASNMELLYRVHHGNYYTVLGDKTGLVGVITDDPEGFYC